MASISARPRRWRRAAPLSWAIPPARRVFLAPQINLVNDAPQVVLGDDADLPAGFALNLPLDFARTGGFSRITLASDAGISMPADVNLQLLPGASLSLIAPNIHVDGAIDAPAGSIAMRTAASTISRTNAGTDSGLYLGAGTQLNVDGLWTNDALSPGTTPTGLVLPDAGSISLTQSLTGGELVIGDGVGLHASGGGWLNQNAQLTVVQVVPSPSRLPASWREMAASSSARACPSMASAYRALPVAPSRCRHRAFWSTIWAMRPCHRSCSAPRWMVAASLSWVRRCSAMTDSVASASPPPVTGPPATPMAASSPSATTSTWRREPAICPPTWRHMPHSATSMHSQRCNCRRWNSALPPMCSSPPPARRPQPSPMPATCWWIRPPPSPRQLARAFHLLHRQS